MAQEVLDAERLFSKDDRYFFEKLIIIEDRDRNRIPFILNPAQEILQNNLSGRDLIIKGGQMGITTFVLARNFKETITNSGTTSVILAHEEPLTQRLLRRTNVWYDMLPAKIAVRDKAGNYFEVPKPTQTHNSDNEKYFASINSVFYIGTARAYVFGRGEPIHRFHGSEVAFWPNAERILVPTIQRVPLDTGEMILESTPNGEDNEFYNMVMDAHDNPNSVWKLHTLPWWLEPTYRLPPGHVASLPKDKKAITDFTADEIALIKRLHWDDVEADERCRWRRLKVAGIQRMFWQEFYEDITTCFLVTKDAYYNGYEIDRLRASCEPPIDHWDYGTEIWNKPDEDWDNPTYLIGVDPGQGKTTVSVATVWRIDPNGVHQDNPQITMRHEATLAGLYEPRSFAAMVKKLGYYYRTAKISSERNGHGQAFCAEIADYPSIYRQTDIQNGKSTSVIGWQTTGAAKLDSRGTKVYMMDELNFVLPSMECKDENLISQIARVRVGVDKKIDLPKQDDYHDSACIAAATKSSARGHGFKGLAFTKGWKWG